MGPCICCMGLVFAVCGLVSALITKSSPDIVILCMRSSTFSYSDSLI